MAKMKWNPHQQTVGIWVHDVNQALAAIGLHLDGSSLDAETLPTGKKHLVLDMDIRDTSNRVRGNVQMTGMGDVDGEIKGLLFATGNDISGAKTATAILNLAH